MCGIAGFAGRDAQARVSADQLAAMAAALRHRGPDGSGTFIAAGVGLAVQRLAIVDLEHGHQPIANEDGLVVVVANCEIYNAPELRAELLAHGHRFATTSDAEPIVHLYEEHGPDLVGRLRGMFAFALWDARTGRLLLARDRLGIKPLYYYAAGEGIWFASEQKALTAAGPAARRPDRAAIARSLALGIVHAPDTLLAGVAQLEPGQLLAYHDGKIDLRRYWTLPTADRESRAPADEWAEQVRGKLEESVRLHLRSDVPVAAWLSTGIDSSAIAALVARSGARVETLSLALGDGPGDELAGDDPGTRLGVALPNRRLQLPPVSLDVLPRLVWHAEIPYVFELELPRWALAEATAADYKVVLSGEGADELFGGYAWARTNVGRHLLSALPRPMRRALGALAAVVRPSRRRVMTPGDDLDLLAYSMRVRGTFNMMAAVLHGQLRIEMVRQAKAIAADRQAATALGPPDERMRGLDVSAFLPGRILPALDRMTMAHSLEGRVPYLDHELVEVALRAPIELWRPQQLEKMLLRRALRGILPAAALERPKRAFTIYASGWLRGPLPGFAGELLSERCLRDKGYFDPSAVAALVAQRESLDMRRMRALSTVLGYQLWDELFVHGTSVQSLSRR